MLERLLNTVATGGVYTPRQLADRLGVSEGLVKQMLADLSRMGYLRPVDSPTCETPASNHCAAPCVDCPLAAACAADGPGIQMWALTEGGGVRKHSAEYGDHRKPGNLA